MSVLFHTVYVTSVNSKKMLLGLLLKLTFGQMKTITYRDFYFHFFLYVVSLQILMQNLTSKLSNMTFSLLKKKIHFSY